MSDFVCFNAAKEEFQTIKKELVDIICSLNDYDREKELSKNVIIYRLIKSMIELLEVLYKISDFKSIRSQLTIQRTIVNYYSILYLLTSYNSKEEQNLRYYLFLLDTFKSRKKNLLKIKKETPEKRLRDLKQKVDELELGDEKSYQDVLIAINEKKLNSIVTKDIITWNNWKFKNPNLKNQRENKFSWKELAEISKIPGRFATFYQDYASEFIHGTGSSIIIEDNEKNTEQTINSTMELSSVLMCLIIKIILNEFAEEVKFAEINSIIKEKCNYLWNNKN